MAGLSGDRSSLDLVIGQAALNLSLAFAEVVRVNNMLQGDPRFTDANLAADPSVGGYGYTSTELDSLKPAFVKLALLEQIASSLAAPDGFDDYFFFARNLMGVRYQP